MFIVCSALHPEHLAAGGSCTYLRLSPSYLWSSCSLPLMVACNPCAQFENPRTAPRCHLSLQQADLALYYVQCRKQQQTCHSVRASADAPLLLHRSARAWKRFFSLSASSTSSNLTYKYQRPWHMFLLM